MIKKANEGYNFDNVDILQLTKKIKTPFFLFSENVLRENYQNFYNYFSSNYPHLRIDYSVKTNNEIAVLRILKELGSQAEISAGYELSMIKKAGFAPSQAVFDSPVKSEEEVNFCLDEGIHSFHVDSFEELKLLNRLAGKKRKKAAVSLRINLGLTVLTGMAEFCIRKFGFPMKNALPAYRTALSLPNLKIIGLMTHLGSQINRVSPYLTAVKQLVQLAKQLEKEGIPIKEINLGGGFPSRNTDKLTVKRYLFSKIGIDYKEKVIPLEEFGEKISKKFSKESAKLKSKPCLALEPGRSISAGMGIAVSQVKVVKKNWLFLDLSSSSLPESWFFAQRRIIFISKNGRGDRPLRRYNVAGKGLNTADFFALGMRLPKMEVGDLAIILDAGAYSISKANRFTFLPPPVYLITASGKIIKIRRAENYEDVIRPMEK